MKGLNVNKSEKMVDLLFNNAKVGNKKKEVFVEKKGSVNFEKVLNKKTSTKSEMAIAVTNFSEAKEKVDVAAQNKEEKKMVDGLLTKREPKNSSSQNSKGTEEAQLDVKKVRKTIPIEVHSRADKLNVKQSKDIDKSERAESEKENSLQSLVELNKMASLNTVQIMNKKESFIQTEEKSPLVNNLKPTEWEAKSKGGQRVEEVKHMHQINALKTLARELTQLNQNNEFKEVSVQTPKENGTKGKEMAKELVTAIQLNFTTDKKTEVVEQPLVNLPSGKLVKSDGNVLLSNEIKTNNRKKNEPEKPHVSELKSAVEGVQFNSTSEIKQDAIKVSGIKEVGEVIAAQVDEFVNLKVVNSKKIVLHLNQDNLGRVEIQIEKKGDTIHIVVKMEEKSAKEKIESSMDNLKLNLEDKKIEIEFKVERETEKEDKEKRKEQEEYAKKENKREQGGKNHELSEQFEDMMGVE